VTLDSVEVKKTGSTLEPKMGGGLRHNTGKAELSYVPSSTLFAISKVFMYGAQKYSPNNWRRGMSWTSVYNCLQRHLLKWYDGEELDDESLVPHLYHIIANAAMLIEYAETYKDGDDRFKGKINEFKDSFEKYEFGKYNGKEDKARKDTNS